MRSFSQLWRSSRRAFTTMATTPEEGETGKKLLGLATVAVTGFFAFDAGKDFATSHKYLQKADAWFEEAVEWISPGKPGPWLLDLETMKYPEYIPTLVMDMDKVLVHMEHDSRQGWRVVRRPGADQFLRELQHYFELVVFSDDVFPVAIDVVSKWGVPCTGVLHREFCKKNKDDGNYVKDLSKLGRRMDKVILLDHDPTAGKFQPENTIVLKPFEGDETDRELFDILELLKAAATAQEDVRKFIAKFGGGDQDIGRRYLLRKKELEHKVQSRRAFGRALVGGSAALPPNSNFGR